MTRWSRLLAGGVAAVAIAGTAPWLVGAATASQDTPPTSGDPRATAYAGNITQDGNGTDHTTGCALLGFPNDQSVGADEGNGLNSGGFVVTNDGNLIDVSAVPTGVSIDAFVVKGSDAYNVYLGPVFTSLPVDGLHAPINASGGPAGVSHWFLCYGPSAPAPQITPPNASATGDCHGADVVLTAGSSTTTFVVTRAGDLIGTPYVVNAGQSQTVQVPLDSAHPSVSVTVNNVQVGNTFTRSTDCDTDNGGGGDNNGGGGDNNGGGGDNNGGGGDNNGGGGDNNGGGGNNTSGGTPPGDNTPPPVTPPSGGTGGSTSGGGTTTPVTNPAVSATKTCSAGITLTLTNLGGTAPVTFTLTGPDGSTSTVTLQPNQSATRSFAVAEDTTAQVTASAPGVTRTFTYHKNCTQVLGVKHVRHSQSEGAKVPAGVKATGSQLPFTGFAARNLVLYAQLIIMFGGLACWTGRRRRAQRAR